MVNNKFFRLMILLIGLASFALQADLNAQTSGPTTPEVNSFEPVNMTSSVNEATGEFSYNLPLFGIPGGPNGDFPLGLSYHAGIPYDGEASWVGLGWNLSVGQVTRYRSGYPDDYKPDANLNANLSQTMFTSARYSHSLTLGIGPANFHWWGTSLKGLTFQGVSVSLDYFLKTGEVTDENKEKHDIGINLHADVGLSRKGSGFGLHVNSISAAGPGFTADIGSSGVGISGGSFETQSEGLNISIGIPYIFSISYSRVKYWVDGTLSMRAYGYLYTQEWWTHAPWCADQNDACDYDHWKDWKSDFFEDVTFNSWFKEGLGSTEDTYLVQSDLLQGAFKPYRTSYMVYPSSNLNKSIEVYRQFNENANVRNMESRTGSAIVFRFLNDGGELSDDIDASNISGEVGQTPSDVKGKKIVPSYDSENKLSGFTITNSDGTIFEFAEPVYSNYEKNWGGSSDGSEYNFTELYRKYAYAWLLTAIKSADYVDRTLNGPSDDDYGEWITFEYETISSGYEWRTPSTGLNAADVIEDNGENFKSQYTKALGNKDIKLLKKAETRTHVAFFDKSLRDDGYSILDNGLSGTIGTKRLQKLDNVSLYNKKYWIDGNGNGIIDRNEVSNMVKKCAFTYDYSLAKGSPNSDGNANGTKGELSGDGRLTLTSMALYGQNALTMPAYKFTYYDTYNYLGVDKWDNWGYYMSGAVKTDHRRGSAVGEAQAWSLKSMTFPTGATVNINYEDKDYTYISNIQLTNTTFEPSIYPLSYISESSTTIFGITYYNYTITLNVADAGSPGIFNVNGNLTLSGDYFDGTTTVYYNLNGSEKLPWSSDNGWNVIYTGYSTTRLPSWMLGATIQGESRHRYPWLNVTRNITKTGGGIRVKYLEYVDGGKRNYTNYRYTDGVATQIPAPFGDVSIDERPAAVKADWQLFGLSSPQIYYKSIKVFESNNTTDAPYGYTLYNNFTPYDYPVSTSYQRTENTPSDGEFWRMVFKRENHSSSFGLPKSIEKYSSTNALVYSKNFTYSFDAQNVYNATGGTVTSQSKMIGFVNQDIKNVYRLSPPGRSFISWGIHNIYRPRLTQVSETKDGVTTTSIAQAFDFRTETEVQTKTTRSSNHSLVTVRTPAYWKFPGMETRNVLLPIAQEKTFLDNELDNTKLLDASVTTYSNLWLINGSQYTDIWRPNDTYTYNREIDFRTGGDGVFSDFPYWNNYTINSAYPVVTSTSPWRMTSNVTQVDQYQNTLESLDPSGNYLASKYSYKGTLPTMIVKNARLSECGFLGVEDTYEEWTPGGSISSVGQVHTGAFSAYCTNVFGPTKEFYVSSGLDKTKPYRFEAWIWREAGACELAVQFYFSNTPSKIVTVSSGTGWQYVSLTITPQDMSDFSSSSYIRVRCGFPYSSSGYVDDVRFRPLDASMSTFTYEPYTLKLTSITDQNNITTYYEYDDAGRLVIVRDKDKNVINFHKYNYGLNN